MVKQRTKRIQELERQLAGIDKLAATGRMVARIAHEINNPLAGIKNSFLLIKNAIPKDYPYYDYVPRIEKEIDRIIRIMRQMIDLYRPNQMAAHKFELKEVIYDVVALLEFSCREGEVTFTYDLPDKPAVVLLPEDWLRQVLFNLFENAIEASPCGGVVKVRATVDDDHFSILVIDQGSGIPEDINSRIFEPFFSSKSNLSKGGLGLGLPISRSLVETMGGSLDFQNQTGGETIFRTFLPRRGPKKEVQDG